MIINSIQSNKYFRNFEYFMHKGILKKEKKVIKWKFAQRFGNDKKGWKFSKISIIMRTFF